MRRSYFTLIAVTLVINFLISIFLWNNNYLGIREKYRENVSFYEVLVTSLGNIRYTLAAYLWIRTEFYLHYSGHVVINQLPEIVYYARFITILDPSFVEAYDFGSYQLAFFLDKPLEGITFIKEGIKNNPDYWKLYYTAGVIYTRKIREYDDALRCFKKAEELLNDPIKQKKYSHYKVENTEIGYMYRFMSRCFYEQGDYTKALEYYNKSYNYIQLKTELYNEIIEKLNRR
ncbi:MAG: tetratricopeptide repeat protein [Candidatus Calescibacterium sp.]|nr:tetratricopeptide repeat protein [Candidatus Calescibacterium sp.]MCX7972090.1 tetratricopeptide repeat protein [bacterium]MDW8194625.1 tetratricopeptide repeat protein [Candidatus Calescibacterium sp.]